MRPEDGALSVREVGTEAGHISDPVRRLLRDDLMRPGPAPRAPRSGAPGLVSLALQGGGSLGAFTWGVLDRLLEEKDLAFDAISGTSAGAVNAVVLADGLARGGRGVARERLERVWRRISNAAVLTSFGARAPLLGGALAFAAAALDLSTHLLSPYQFNPLAFNPLRDILAEEVDFDRLRSASPVRLLVAATRVRDGGLQLFREQAISLEAMLASACLPLLFHAVAIDGEWYWDGGYTSNPPLVQLTAISQAPDVILVQLTPTEYEGRPTFSPEIVKRLAHISFNSPLLKELETLSSLQRLGEQEDYFSPPVRRRLLSLRLHRIAAEDALPGHLGTNGLDLDWSFLTRLRDSGRAAAESWLTGQRLSQPCDGTGCEQQSADEANAVG